MDSVALLVDQKGESKLLTVKEFEAFFQLKFSPGLDFLDLSLLGKIRKKTIALQNKNRLTRDQLWMGAYFKREILSLSMPSVTLKWVSPDIGWGVFARTAIKKMTFIGEYGGKVRKRTKEDTKNGYCFEYIFAEKDTSSYIIDAQDQGGIVRYINHSSAPNLLSALATVDGITHVILIAKETISAGSQLLYDYGDDYWKFRCPPKPL